MKFSSQKIIAALLAALVISGVAFGIYQARAGDKPEEISAGQAQTVTATTVPQTETTAPPSSKTDNSGNYAPPEGPAPPASEPSPPADSQLSSLSCFVTAEQTGTDGTITVSFYGLGPGMFTVQQKAANVWQTTSENITYGGSGGIPAATMALGDESLTVRLLKSENGRYIAASKEFIVLRQEVVAAGGIKTYN